MSEAVLLDCDRCGRKVSLARGGEFSAHHCRTPRERALDAAERAAVALALVRDEIAITAEPLTPAQWAAVTRLLGEVHHETARTQVALRAAAQVTREDAAAKAVRS